MSKKTVYFLRPDESYDSIAPEDEEAFRAQVREQLAQEFPVIVVPHKFNFWTTEVEVPDAPPSGGKDFDLGEEVK